MNKKSMRIHCFQHVEFEDLGCIKDWCANKGHPITYTRFYLNEDIPPFSEYDWLIILGGPMNIYAEEQFPWLRSEKVAIKEAINKNKIVLGICLGAQLIADVLGAKVSSNDTKEIGWFDISLTPQARNERLFRTFDDKPFKVFHWHGDSFEIPKTATHLATSKAYNNQAFLHKSNVLGLQFHLEVTDEGLREMVENGRSELAHQKQKYIQSEETIKSQQELVRLCNLRMFQILNTLESLERE